MAHGNRVSEPLTAVELSERLGLVRQVIQLADRQIPRAEGDEKIAQIKGDLKLARVGLAELQQEIKARGLAPSEGGAS